MINNYQYFEPFDRQTTYTGRLQINVFYESVAYPVDNVLVAITNKNNNTDIVEELLTNSLGQTSLINLLAPSPDYSMDNVEQPYSEYDVHILIGGLEVFKINGTQIFPNTTAYQNVYLNDKNMNQENTITVQEPTLWGAYPPKNLEDDIKGLPPSLGYVVLPDPVIPEFIIVHDGAPNNSNVRNIKIPFKEYITNVACSEIYSTWPTETIKANVLAIISFTLNRVYTEWYKSKGYNFTITSSSAYDQTFNYGRTIYKEISVIVDTLFTTYVTKPNIRQPYFTQYCDGKKSICPKAMSQWGSKALGEQGHLATAILKYYYGQDVFLMKAKKIDGIPVSFNGKNLQMGSRGAEVRVIQEQLNAISNNYSTINKLRVDGIFGKNTRTAVETFQTAFVLPSTGIVDFATWYKISRIFVAVTKLSEIV